MPPQMLNRDHTIPTTGARGLLNIPIAEHGTIVSFLAANPVSLTRVPPRQVTFEVQYTLDMGEIRAHLLALRVAHPQPC